jgi:xanthine dehydrogenase accessory factor
MVVVATQGHGDEEAVQQAIAARPAYLGLVGSSRRGASVLGYLAERGVPSDQLDRVRVPAGLDLGRTSHREIAVAILAELVQLRASGVLGGAGSPTEAGSTVEASTVEASTVEAGSTGGAAEPAEAVDPVCGMTVAADPSSYPLEHEGVTYHFCRAGCRRAFEKDPAAYVKKETRC